MLSNFSHSKFSVFRTFILNRGDAEEQKNQGELTWMCRMDRIKTWRIKLGVRSVYFLRIHPVHPVYPCQFLFSASRRLCGEYYESACPGAQARLYIRQPRNCLRIFRIILQCHFQLPISFVQIVETEIDGSKLHAIF